MMTFHFRLWPSVFVCLLFFALMQLGFWQLRRYHETQHLLHAFHTAMAADPKPLPTVSMLTHPEFHRVVIRGIYLNAKTILLANRLAEHQGGFDVVTPFLVSNEKKAILIDRGFIPLEFRGTRNSSDAMGDFQGGEMPFSRLNASANSFRAQRQSQEGVRTKCETPVTMVTGYIKFPDSYAFILGNEILNPGHFPLQIQKIDMPAIERATRLSLYPFFVRLAPTDVNGFYREWPITTIMPARHLAYAVQWFGMAFVLLIAYGFFIRNSR